MPKKDYFIVARKRFDDTDPQGMLVTAGSANEAIAQVQARLGSSYRLLDLGWEHAGNAWQQLPDLDHVIDEACEAVDKLGEDLCGQ